MADRAVDMLTEAILERDQPRTTDLFHRMVAREGRSIGEALGAVTTAEAPCVQVPSHINVRDGQIRLINNDHTILGLRTAASLAPGNGGFAQVGGLRVLGDVVAQPVHARREDHRRRAHSSQHLSVVPGAAGKAPG